MLSTLSCPMTTSTSPISLDPMGSRGSLPRMFRVKHPFQQQEIIKHTPKWHHDVYIICVLSQDFCCNISCASNCLYITPFNDCPKIPGETWPLPVHEIYVFMSTVFKSNNGVWETQKLEHLWTLGHWWALLVSFKVPFKGRSGRLATAGHATYNIQSIPTSILQHITWRPLHQPTFSYFIPSTGMWK